MADFYAISQCKYNPFYAELDTDTIPRDFENACYSSLFQLIDPYASLKIEVTEESPEKYSDFMYMAGIPLISDYMKSLFDDFGIDNVLYKRIILENPVSLNLHECWLALPPAIVCLDYEKSTFMPFNNNMVDNIVLDKRQLGRYNIFKISGRTNRTVGTDAIVLTEKFHKFLMETSEKNKKILKGVYINKLY